MNSSILGIPKAISALLSYTLCKEILFYKKKYLN